MLLPADLDRYLAYKVLVAVDHKRRVSALIQAHSPRGDLHATFNLIEHIQRRHLRRAGLEEGGDTESQWTMHRCPLA